MNDGIHRVDARLTFDEGYQPREHIGKWVHTVFIVDREVGKLSAVVNGVLMQDSIDISNVTGSILSPKSKASCSLITVPKEYNRSVQPGIISSKHRARVSIDSTTSST